MSPSRPIVPLVVALVVAFAIPITTWFWLYPTFGYGPGTLSLAQASVLVAAAVLVAASDLRWADLGLGPRSLVTAVVVGAAAYAAIVLVAGVLNAAFDAGFVLVRSRYEAAAFIDNWLLTAAAGARRAAGTSDRRRPTAVPLSAPCVSIFVRTRASGAVP